MQDKMNLKYYKTNVINTQTHLNHTSLQLIHTCSKRINNIYVDETLYKRVILKTLGMLKLADEA